MNVATKRRMRNAVVARDGWVCALCGGKVKQLADYAGDPLRPSLDHIVPRSEGGPNTVDNLQLAHQICNHLRHHPLGKGKHGPLRV